MAGRTVIDEMIVKLGLDPHDFTKGHKEAAASVSNTEKSVQKSAGGMSRQLTGLAAKWLSFAGAIYAIKKAVTIIDDVAERTRKLGVDAKNYGIAAAGLRNFENAVEMFGGTAADARKSIDGINQAVFDMAYNGQMSDSLIMLARLGVQFQTATGEARDFNSIVLDTADAIGKAQEQGMSRASAVQYLRQAGFDEGTSQMILAGRAQAEAALAAQDKRRQVSDSDVSAATEIVQSRTGRRQAWHGGEIEFMQSPAGKAVEAINQAAEELLTPMGAAQAAGKVLDGVAKSGTRLMNLFDSWSVKAAGTRGMRNNNPGNIRAVGDQNRDRQGFRVFGTMEEGIKAADAQLQKYADRGINTIEKIITTWAPPSENDTKAYINNVVGETGIPADEVLDEGSRALILAAMFKHESGSKAPDSSAVADVLTAMPSGAGSNSSAASMASPTPRAQASTTYSKTEVQIDNITVQTRATDAEGIADGLDGSVKRKLLASHAEQGMQ